MIGAYYALEGTGEKPVSSRDYGDFGDWDGEQEMAKVLNAVKRNGEGSMAIDSKRLVLKIAEVTEGNAEGIYVASGVGNGGETAVIAVNLGGGRRLFRRFGEGRRLGSLGSGGRGASLGRD